MMKKLVIISLLMITAGSFSAHAQAQSADQDVAAVLGYDPVAVLDDWKSWEANQTASNAYVGEFMSKFEVPQAGLYGLGLHDTWYWWISNHQDEILNQYLPAKAAAEE